MTALRMIDGEGRGTGDACAPIQLGHRSRRPGLAHDELWLDLGSGAASVLVLATHDRLPPPLWAALTIESERALRTVAPEPSRRRPLAARLDRIARTRSASSGRGETRLHAWAAALRHPPAAGPRTAPAQAVALDLLVPYHTLQAWQLAAERAGLPLHEWARSLLATSGAGRAMWEAAAAEAACTLGEWVALSAPGDCLCR
jgi:hypothetical protein